MISKKTQAVITLHMYVHLQSMYNTKETFLKDIFRLLTCLHISVLFLELRPKTSKTASVLNKIKTKKVKKRALFNQTR